MSLVQSVTESLVSLSSVTISTPTLASLTISVFFVLDEFGNILIDENGRFMLVDENGTPIGW